MNACLFLSTLHSEDVLRLHENGELYDGSLLKKGTGSEPMQHLGTGQREGNVRFAQSLNKQR